MNVVVILGECVRLVHAMRRTSVRGALPPLKGLSDIAFFNEPAVATGETASGNANCSARGLAKIAAMMAAGGTWDGRQYLDEQGCQAMHDNPSESDMGSAITRFRHGGVALFPAVATNSTKVASSSA